MLDGMRLYYRVGGFAAVACAIGAKLTRSPSAFDVKRPDISATISVRLPSTDPWAFKQVFIDQEYLLDVEASQAPQVIIDAGANVGYASIYFANRYPDARIFAIEPESNNFETLKRNVVSYPQITPILAALWDEVGEVQLVDPGHGDWGFRVNGTPGSSAMPRIGGAVPTVTIAHLIDAYDLRHIDILKADIEGAEKTVFADTSGWIDCVETIMIELHERTTPGCTDTFHRGTQGFANSWKQGENVCLSRGAARRASKPSGTTAAS